MTGADMTPADRADMYDDLAANAENEVDYNRYRLEASLIRAEMDQALATAIGAGSLTETMAIIRQCREAADAIEAEYPVAARLLRHEAERWDG